MEPWHIEHVVYGLASEFYPDYPDPMPDFQFLGNQGKALLESALSNPMQTFGGRFVYQTIYDKSAILLWSIIKNHPFVDGNKRMGLTSTFVFMVLNGYVLVCPRERAIGICLRIAGAYPAIDLSEVTEWLTADSIPLDLISEWAQSSSDVALIVQQLAEVSSRFASMLARLESLARTSPTPDPNSCQEQ